MAGKERSLLRAETTSLAETASSDGALVRAARRGDRAAFSDLYSRYGRMVHGALVARVPVADAEDLVQDVFLAALRRLPSLREEAAFGAWLLTIARNRATDYWKRQRARGELPDDLGEHQRPAAEVARVLAAIRDLPEAYRETLSMRLVEGMSGAEIAELTGLAPGSVRVNLHRGMKLLREKLNVEVSR